MTYALVRDGVIERYPYSITDLRIDHPETSFPAFPSEQSLAEWGVFPVTSTSPPPLDPMTQEAEWGAPELVDGAWTQTWTVRAKTPEEQAAAMQQRIAEFEAGLDAYLDSVAQQRRFRDRHSLALRAGYEGPYQAEAIVFAAWMDQCNVQAYTLLQNVIDGTATPPSSVEELIATLPPIVWPE
jgi:hypothetical protein